MKKAIILTGLAAFVLLAGVSCKQDKKNAPAAPGIDTLKTEAFVEAKTIQLKKDYRVEYSLSVEYVEDERLDPVVADSINCAIAQAMFGKRDPQVKALAIAEEAKVREWFEEGIWEGDDEDEEEEAFMKEGEWQVSGEFSHTAPEGYTNYNIAGYQYFFGAAHGYYYFLPIVIDLGTGCRVHDTQLFREDYEDELSALLLKYLEEQEDYEEGMLWEEGIHPNDNFTLSKEGITYYYNPYEIAAYVFGLIAVDVPAADLKPLLAEEYAHIWE